MEDKEEALEEITGIFGRKITSYFKTDDWHLEFDDKTIENYKDISGNVLVNVFADDNNKIGEIVLDIKQRNFDIDELTQMRDLAFGDFIEYVMMKNIKRIKKTKANKINFK